MGKARLKSILLVGLILSSIVLTCHIWFSEKLWPDGYNFFANIPFSFGKGELQSTLTKETLSDPNRIVVTNVEKRNVYTPDTQESIELVQTVKDILKLALTASGSASATEEEWNGTLRSKSIHVTYPVAYDGRLFASIMGVPQDNLGLKAVQEFVIFAGDIVSSNVSVYSRDAVSGEVVKIGVRYDKAALLAMIEQLAVDSIGAPSYSFELHFDDHTQETQDQQPDANTMVSQNVYLESDVLVMLNRNTGRMMKEINLLYDNDYNQGMVEEILRCFGYNSSGSRKYMESDNSVVYVENYGTIKIHPNGLVEYKAVDLEKGIPLDSSAAGTSYDSILACVDFVNTLWNSVYPGQRLNVNISSDVVDIRNKDFTLTMDYYADGTVVSMELPQTNSHEALEHAVEIQVADNRIVSYRQVMTFFEPTEETINIGSAIDALDILFADSQLNGNSISDLYLTYVMSGSTLWRPTWAAKVDGEIVKVAVQ